VSAVPRLAVVPVTYADVEVAWATYRALILAEVDDQELATDLTHQRAVVLAKERFQRAFDELSSVP
jgi:hypothetical protein